MLLLRGDRLLYLTFMHWHGSHRQQSRAPQAQPDQSTPVNSSACEGNIPFENNALTLVSAVQFYVALLHGARGAFPRAREPTSSSVQR